MNKEGIRSTRKEIDSSIFALLVPFCPRQFILAIDPSLCPSAVLYVFGEFSYSDWPGGHCACSLCVSLSLLSLQKSVRRAV